MARNTEIISVSVSKEQAKAVEELSLSPSSLLQDAIDKAVEHSRFILQSKKDIESLKQAYWKATQCFSDFLDSKHIDYSEYNQYVFAWNKRKEAEGGTNQLVEG